MSLSVKDPKTLFDLLLGHVLRERAVAHCVERVWSLTQAANSGAILHFLGMERPSKARAQSGRRHSLSVLFLLDLGQLQESGTGREVVAFLPAHGAAPYPPRSVSILFFVRAQCCLVILPRRQLRGAVRA